MKNSKNTFIRFIILAIVGILGFQGIQAYFLNQGESSSYVILESGSAILNENNLILKEKEEIQSGDILETFDNSLAIVAWGDGSLTRLGENSKIEIKSHQIAKDKSAIQIAFHLFSGKTWSNVVSYIHDDSSFKQSFDDVEAGVRGTVFDVDLVSDFLRVSNHEVVLQKNSGDFIVLQEGEVVDTKEFSIVNLQEFLESFEDIDWTKLNSNKDMQYIDELTEKLKNEVGKRNPFLFILEYFSPKYRLLYELDTAESYESIEKLLGKIKEKHYPKIYDLVLKKYQKYNFVSSSQYEFYKRKIFYKKALVFLTPDENVKEQLLRTSLYDLRDTLEAGGKLGVEETLEFISENKDIMGEIDLSFMKKSFEIIPEGLRESFGDNFKDLQNLIPDFDIGNLGDVKNIGSSGKEVLENVEGSIKNFLDNNAGGIIDSFKN